MELLDLLKHSLYIDGTFEDEYLAFLIETSRNIIQDSFDNPVDETQAKFKHAVILLASHYYINRSETSEMNLKSIPFGVNSLIQQMRYSDEN